MSQRRTFRLFKSETFTQVGGSKKAETDARSVIVLAGNLVREEDRRLKKSQNGRSEMQSKVEIDQALRSAAGLT
jgi:hypothetical protein